MKEMLSNIACLSRSYGSNPDYVFLGGGNTSVKTADSLFVKPSGVALATIQPEQFLQVDRKQLNKLFDIPLPDNSQIREEYAKNMLASAVRPLGAGRPSVETPLHNIINYTYIVHLHPALINGMTCSLKGPEVAKRLFPKALWMDYCDAGCKLAFVAKEALDEDTRKRGHQPHVIFLQNHGVFVGADSPEELNSIYDHLFTTLQEEYRKADIPIEQPPLGVAETSDVLDLAPAFRGLLADENGNRPVVYSAGCTLPYAGPLTPDHIVYAKSFAYVGDATPEALQNFKNEHGYLPKVIGVPGRGLFTVGATVKEAKSVAIAVANALQVQRLAEAFGGPKFMTPKEYQFIENWEVESYRRSIANAGKTPKRLDKKIAVIVGATKGNGPQLARELAGQGAIVALVDQDANAIQCQADDIVSAYGPDTAFAFSTSLDTQLSMASMLGEVTRLTGGLDLLIVNAHHDGLNAPVAQIALEDWTQLTQATSNELLVAVKYASRIMRLQKQGKATGNMDIILLTQPPANTAAKAADAAMEALVDGFAQELADATVKVNHICQGCAAPKDIMTAILYCVEQHSQKAQHLNLI